MDIDRIKEIHDRGNLTSEEIVKEWESIGLCAPGDNIGSAKERCEKFGYDCHMCLTDYASLKDEYSPITYKVSESLFSSSIYFPKNEEKDKPTMKIMKK